MLRKIHSFFILFSLVFYIASCSNSDNVSPMSLEGTWLLKAADVNFDDQVVSATSKGLLESGFGNAKFTFNADMTVSAVDGDGGNLYEGTYSFDAAESKLVINDEYQNEIYKYNFIVKLSGNALELESIKLDVQNEVEGTDEEFEVAFAIYSLLLDQEDDLGLILNPDAKTSWVTYKFEKQ